MAEADRPPIPDPTSLTTDAVQREVAQLKELIVVQLGKADEICDEKFRSMDRRFELVEQQRIEQKDDTKTAVNAALAAQKEAVREQTTASERSIEKSEKSTIKSIDELRETFSTALQGERRDLDDLKERIATVESAKRERRDASSDSARSVGLYITAASAIVAFGSIVTAVILHG